MRCDAQLSGMQSGGGMSGKNVRWGGILQGKMSGGKWGHAWGKNRAG